MKRVHTLVILLALILAMLPDRAEGTLIRHTFEGTITELEGITPPAPWDGTAVGSIWEMSYIFDTELPDQNPTSEVGRYFIDNGSISVDGVELFAVFGEITVQDGQFGFDEYRVLLGDFPLGGGGVSLAAPPGTLVSDAIPIDFNLQDFGSRQFEFGGGSAGFPFFLRGDVTSFISDVVPAPGAFLLLAFNTCFLVRNRRRRHL